MGHGLVERRDRAVGSVAVGDAGLARLGGAHVQFVEQRLKAIHLRAGQLHGLRKLP